MTREGLVAAVLTALLVVALVMFAAGAVTQEGQKRPQIPARVQASDYGYLYQFYVAGRPNVEGWPWYGEAGAPVSLVMYTALDGCEACARFFATRFKEIEAAYIGPGLVKFYHKPALSRQDVEAKSANYRRAAALHCAAQMQSDKYWGFFFSIQNASLDGLVPAAESAGFSGPAFAACLESDLPALREAMAETETFGIMTLPTLYLDVRGISPHVFRGVPPPGQLRQAMRAYELMMGR